MLKVGELAQKAGLTVRTLHHYDSIGLLRPSARSDAGYRLYDHQDVVRLHQIQALRRFGMALTGIGAFLANPEASPLSIVGQQIAALDRQIEEAGRMRAQLQRLHGQLSKGEEPELAAWLTTLEQMTMYEKYFSKEELDQLPLYQNPEAEYEWKLLVMQVRQAMEADVAPRDAHQLALKWMELLDRDTGGNADLMRRLDRMHVTEPSVQKETGISLDMRSYVMRAINEVKLGLYAKYLLPDELAQMRRHFETRGQEWPGLIEQIKTQMRADPSPNNPAARALSAKWMALFHDMVGSRPETIQRFRTATESEPILRVGRAMNDEMIAFLRAADGRGAGRAPGRPTMLKKPVRILMAAMLAFFISAAHAAPAEVYLIGTLYQRHDQASAFSTDVLRRMILDIKPDVLVLDVTPDELAKKVVHPSKIEYTRTVFPLVAEKRYLAYPAEPAEPTFTEIVSGLTARLRQWEQQDPAAAATYKRAERALFGVLIPYWSTASRVQDDVTAEALASLAATQEMLVGDVLKSANARWDRHTADAVVAAAAKHPGTRILVLTGIRNRPHVKAHLASVPQVRLVDMPAWLSKAGY